MIFRIFFVKVTLFATLLIGMVMSESSTETDSTSGSQTVLSTANEEQSSDLMLLSSTTNDNVQVSTDEMTSDFSTWSQQSSDSSPNPNTTPDSENTSTEETTISTLTTDPEDTTVVTTGPQCILFIQSVTKNDSSISFLGYTNIEPDLFSCHKANETTLIVLDESAGLRLGDQVIEIEFTCNDLLPSNEYFIVFPTECDQNETISITTDFEKIRCQTDETDPQKIHSVCEPLRCVGCGVRFQLIDLERNQLLSSFSYIDENLTSIIDFEHTFETDYCGISNLWVDIFKEPLGNSSQHVSKKMVMPKDIEFDLSSTESQAEFKISFELKLTNMWSKCIDATVSVELKKPSNCEASIDSDQVVLVFNNNASLSGLEGQYQLVIPDSIDEPKFTYMTTYRVLVEVAKSFENDQPVHISASKLLQTDGYLSRASEFTSTTNSISFVWQKPPDCVPRPLVTCLGIGSNVTANLDDLALTGTCNGLQSNFNHTISVYSFNKAGKTNTYAKFTTVEPAVIRQAQFERHTLNMVLNLEFTGTYDSLRVCYRDNKDVQASFTCQSSYEETQPGTFLVKFSKGELLFANSYDVVIETTGCSELKCHKSSNTSQVTSGLDSFNFPSSLTPTLFHSETGLEVNLYNSSLPFKNYGRLALVCRRKPTNTVMPSQKCDFEFPWIVCRCENLTPGTLYSADLENSLDGFETRNETLGECYTDVAKANLSQVYFEEHSLNGRFQFTQRPSYVSLSFCCWRKELSYDDLACFGITNTSNAFSQNNLANIEFGREYSCMVRTVGAGSQKPEESQTQTARTDLDLVKVSQTHPMTTSDREINMTFDNSLLPNGSFSDISIRCLSDTSNVVRVCAREPDRVVCRCNGNSLVPATEYLVSLFTNKTGGFQAREREIRHVHTNPEAIRYMYCDPYERSLRVYCEIGNTRIKGIKLKAQKQLPEGDAASAGSELETRLETERVCLYEATRPGPNCELIGSQFFYNYSSLDPGTVYLIEARTFYLDYNSSVITRRCATQVDRPVFRSFSVVSGNRLRLEFALPETEFCNITFKLMEKANEKSVFLIYDEVEFYRGAEVHNVFSADVVFPRKLSSSTGVKYKVEVSIFKEITALPAVKFEFEQVYSVPFPDYLIAIIVICSVLLLASIPAGYFAYKKWQSKKPLYEFKTLHKPERLGEVLSKWDENQNAGCEKEWSDLCKVTEENIVSSNYQMAGTEPRDVNKNRYQDILPYEHSRVKLATNDEDDISTSNNYIHDDYINASFIPGLKSETKYIACQAPLERTIKDFWRMIWERYVSVVVMLANIYEQDRCVYDAKLTKNNKKCDTYWPETVNKPTLFGEMLVTLVKEFDRGDFIVRKIVVETDGVKQTVTQYHYKAWPDKKFPKKESLYEFMETIRKNTTVYDKKGPVVVHCSAGIGRTGTYLAIDPLMELIANKKPVDIFNRVVEMRKYRPKMVQNPVQYRFIYEFLHYCYEKENQNRNSKDSNDIEMYQFNR